MKRSRAYVIMMLCLALLALCGMALLIWGATRQGPLPHPRVLLVPPQVNHG